MALSRLCCGWKCFYSKQVHDVPVTGYVYAVSRQSSRKDVPGVKSATKLNVQLEDKSLPAWLVKEICEHKSLKELDLSECPQLEVLPAAFAAHGVGRRLKELKLPPQLLGALPDAAHAAAAAGREWSPQKKLAAILLRQQRRQAILKLATQPEPMLTTLERMSWLLIILATITLTAFLQPGMEGIVAGNAAKVDVAASRACVDRAREGFLQAVVQKKLFLNATSVLHQLSAQEQSNAMYTCGCTGSTMWISWQGGFSYSFLPCSRYFENLTRQQRQANDMWAACKRLDTDKGNCIRPVVRMRTIALFSVLIITSFCLTLLCLVLIVVVSLPRLKSTNLTYEAGRLWLFLFFIWLMFVDSVQLAFLAFWVYAVAVYDAQLFGDDQYGVFMTGGAGGGSFTILGTICLTLPALVVVCGYFSWIYPGHRAVHLACCSCTCSGYTQDFVDSYTNRDVEEGRDGIYVSACPPAIIKVE